MLTEYLGKRLSCAVAAREVTASNRHENTTAQSRQYNVRRTADGRDLAFQIRRLSAPHAIGPVKSTASIASTLQHIHYSFEGEAAELSRRLLGPRELEKWAGMLDKGAPHREGRESQVFDVHHADFHADPMGTIGRIYDFFGLTLTAEAERLMSPRIADNPDGDGLHHYGLDSFG